MTTIRLPIDHIIFIKKFINIKAMRKLDDGFFFLIIFSRLSFNAVLIVYLHTLHTDTLCTV